MFTAISNSTYFLDALHKKISVKRMSILFFLVVFDSQKNACHEKNLEISRFFLVSLGPCTVFQFSVGCVFI